MSFMRQIQNKKGKFNAHNIHSHLMNNRNDGDSIFSHQMIETLHHQKSRRSILKRMMPDRQIGGIHQISEEEWPWDYLPPFLKDPTFVMSGDVVPRLLLGNLKLHCKGVIRPIL